MPVKPFRAGCRCGRSLPVTHGIVGARADVSGETLASVADLVWAEAFIGLIYALLAYGLFRWFEAQGRRRASLESM
jgi:ABC-2 type transport system permease protein